MTLPDAYRLVSIDRSRGAEMIGVSSWAFSGDIRPEELDGYLDAIPLDRARAMEVSDPEAGEVGTLAAVNAAYTFRMRVPGGAHVPVAGLTWVGVHPGHRRRGLLRAMMADHLADARARGEIASALYAAESEIYQRFGYGLAALGVDLTLSRGARLRDVPGSADLRVRLELLDQARHGHVLREVQERLETPGSMTLDHDMALRSRFHDPRSAWEHEERRRIAVVESPQGEPLAYALFRRAEKWEDNGLPNGTVHVFQHGALTPAARHRLWSVLLDLDLMGSVRAAPFAVDDALLHLAADLRAAQPRAKDNLWLRVVDVPAALTARSYGCDLDLVVSVEDPLFPDNAGPWRITARDGAAHVEHAGDAVPDLTLGIEELSAAYLGGASLTALADAGRVSSPDGDAVARLGHALRADRAPVCNLFF